MKPPITCQRGKLQQADKHEVNVITTFVERKLNDLTQTIEKILHKLDYRIIRLQNKPIEK